MRFVRFFVNYTIFRELCDRMQFEADYAKSHHRVISEGLTSNVSSNVTVTLVNSLTMLLATCYGFLIASTLTGQ